MSSLYTASNYKNTIISLLLKNKDFITLIDPDKPPNSTLSTMDILLGGEWIINGEKIKKQGHIFDYNFVDDITTEEKTFTFVETDINTINDDMFIDFNLYVCIFTLKSLVKITNDTTPSINDVEEMGYNAGYFGNRVDILCDIVDRTLNNNKKIKGIGLITRSPRNFCTIYTPNNKYYGKCLKYHISNYDEQDDECGNQ